MTIKFKSVYINTFTNKFVSRQRYEQVRKLGKTHIIKVCEAHNIEITDNFFCPICAQISAEQAKQHRKESDRKRYQKRKTSGLCRYNGCKKKPIKSITYCKEHMLKINKYDREKYRRNIAKGLCPRCYKPNTNGNIHCNICIAKVNYKKSKYAKQLIDSLTE